MLEDFFGGERLPGRRRNVVKAARNVFPGFDELEQDPYCGVELDTDERREICARNALIVDEAMSVRSGLGTAPVNDVRKIQIRSPEDLLLFAEDVLIQNDQREAFGPIDVEIPEDKERLIRGLFPHGLAIGPIVQGHVGNCDMTAGLGALKAHIVSPYIMAALIHRAYGGYVVDFNDRLSWMARGDVEKPDVFPIGPDFGDRVLEVGTMRSILSERSGNNGVSSMMMGSRTQRVSRHLNGFSSKEFFERFLPKGTMGDVGSISLADFNPNMLCVVSECRNPYACYMREDGARCLDPEREILSHHGYSIDRVEANNGVIVMTNPHNPYKRIRMTLERFNKVFGIGRQLTAVELDPSNFKPILDKLFADRSSVLERIPALVRMELGYRAHSDACSLPSMFADVRHDLGVVLAE